MIVQIEYIHFSEIYRKVYPDLEKEKIIQKMAEIVVKG